MREVPSWQLGYALAAIAWWVGGSWEIQTCKNYFTPRCTFELGIRLSVKKVHVRVPGMLAFGLVHYVKDGLEC